MDAKRPESLRYYNIHWIRIHDLFQVLPKGIDSDTSMFQNLFTIEEGCEKFLKLMKSIHSCFIKTMPGRFLYRLISTIIIRPEIRLTISLAISFRMFFSLGLIFGRLAICTLCTIHGVLNIIYRVP